MKNAKREDGEPLASAMKARGEQVGDVRGATVVEPLLAVVCNM